MEHDAPAWFCAVAVTVVTPGPPPSRSTADGVVAVPSASVNDADVDVPNFPADAPGVDSVIVTDPVDGERDAEIDTSDPRRVDGGQLIDSVGGAVVDVVVVDVVVVDVVVVDVVVEVVDDVVDDADSAAPEHDGPSVTVNPSTSPEVSTYLEPDSSTPSDTSADSSAANVPCRAKYAA